MHQSFVTTAPPPPPPHPPHLGGWAGDRGANVRDSDLLSSPAVPGKCWSCDITPIYPSEFYYYKEQGYDSQQIPVVQGF